MSFPFTVPLSSRDVRTTSVTQTMPLGTRGATADGRVYRYAKAGATALVKGYLMQQEVAANAWGNSTASYLSTQTPTVTSTWATLQLSATMDSTLTVARNYFQDGVLWANGTSTESGQMVRLRMYASGRTTHEAASSGSTGLGATGGQLVVYFEDGEAFSETVDTGTYFALIKNDYEDIIVVPATNPTAQILGVPNSDVTAAYYCWLQTWGPCPVRGDATASQAAGKRVWTSTTVAGTVQGATGSTDLTGTARLGSPVGFVGSEVEAASKCGLVHLTISP